MVEVSSAQLALASVSFEQDERACGHRKAEPQQQTHSSGRDDAVVRNGPFARRRS
jgi:hypothetical protein